jgi:hypothetical protein
MDKLIADKNLSQNEEEYCYYFNGSSYLKMGDYNKALENFNKCL